MALMSGAYAQPAGYASPQALNKNNGKAFDSEDEYHIQLVGTHLGNALSKARLHDTARCVVIAIWAVGQYLRYAEL